MMSKLSNALLMLREAIVEEFPGCIHATVYIEPDNTVRLDVREGRVVKVECRTDARNT